jgi:hypothetical protein
MFACLNHHPSPKKYSSPSYLQVPLQMHSTVGDSDSFGQFQIYIILLIICNKSPSEKQVRTYSQSKVYMVPNRSQPIKHFW